MTVLARTHNDDEPAAGSRQLVLDHAAHLFREHGYAAVSMRDIAAACGIKAGSLYYHFPSKEQIVSEVLDTGVGTVFEHVRGSIEALPPGAPLAERLRVAIGAHLHALLELDDYTGANIRIFGHVPERVRLAALDRRRVYEAWWRDLLAAGEAEGAFAPGTDLRLVRLFLLGAMNWSLEWHRPGSDVEEFADRLTALTLHGVAARDKPPPRRRQKRD
ncbi:MAG: TetR/AcrR family transcriptional regulator [Acetobacteraceae bacterium]